MTPPDEVRAERIGFYRVQFAKQMIRDDRPEAMSEFFASALEALYQSAYASGSAARKERDVGIVRGEIAFRENARHPEAGISGFVDFNEGLHQALELLEEDKC